MNSRSKTFQLTFPAIMAALALLFLYLSSVMPSGRWGLVAVAGLFPGAAVISAGLKSGFGCWAAAGLLGLLLVPDRLCALLFALFFGLYPMVKSILETKMGRWPCFLCKLIFFNAAAAVLVFVFAGLFIPALPWDLWSKSYLVFLWGNPVFIAYDYGISKLFLFYMLRVDRSFSRRNGQSN